MGYLGNIVTERKYKFDPYFKKCRNMEEIDSTVPTLIFGWTDNIHKNYPDQSILNKIISNNLLWSFARDEKRNGYEKDLEHFYKYCLDKASDDIDYHFISLFRMGLKQLKHIHSFLLDENNNQFKKIIYLDNDLGIFILYKKTDRRYEVLGFSMGELEYGRITYQKLVDRLKKNKNNIVVEDSNFLTPQMRRIMESEKPIYPYLFSIRNNCF